MYRVKKVINNNFISSIDQSGNQVIIRGLGIGFQKKPGEWINSDKVEVVYKIDDKVTSNKLQELISQVPKEYIDTSTEIIDNIKSKLDKKLNDNIYITLTDHLSFAIERKKLNQEYSNVLLWDIKRFYQQEYELGKESLSIIKKNHGIELSVDEAGFIALHIVNGQLDEDVHDMYEITKIMQEIENIVRYHFKIEFNEESAYYYRFITHLKFFAQRLVEHKKQNKQEDDLLEVVQVKYVNAYQCVEKIAMYIKNQYNYELYDEEKLYLTIHIHRVVYLGNSH